MTRISLPAPTPPSPTLAEKWEKARAYIVERGLSPCGKWRLREERRKHDRTPIDATAVEVTVPQMKAR